MFRPKEQEPTLMEIDQVQKLETSHFTEYRATLKKDWGSFVLRTFPGQSEMEVDFIVGPIESMKSQIKI